MPIKMIGQLPRDIIIERGIFNQKPMEKIEKPWRLRIASSCAFNYLEPLN